VVGCAGILAVAGRNDEIVLDGSLGEVVLHPSKMLQAKYRGIARQRRVQHEEVLAELGQPTITLDGHEVKLLANVELADEVQHAFGHGARGIGLFRTEFLYLHGETLPSEEEQLSVYREVLDTIDDGPALFRTFDLGSDKLSRHIAVPREENPALGLRACRLGLQREELFRTQIRALLRATAHRRGALMLPMISGIAELRQVKALIHDEMDRLERSGTQVWREVPIGIMVELPSAVWVADRLALECDFFSVGTNDLMQYSLAIDRGNEHVAYLYRPLHLSNLRALAHVAAAAKSAGIPLSLCGEMAADPLCAAMCVALGYDTLSMPPASIPRVAWMMRRLKKADLDVLLAESLDLAHVEEIEGHVRHRLYALLPELARRD
jgi:phosphotransferase system enzyme I (PtsI)